MAWRRGLLACVLACAGATLLPAVAAAQPSTFSETVSGAPIQVGGSVTLTFTITVPDALSPLTTAAFTDTLPPGIQLTGAPSTTCVGGTATSSGASNIGFSDSLIPAGCTVTATVEGTAVGHWDNPVTLSTDQGPESTDDAFIDVAGPPSISISTSTSLLGLNATAGLSFVITNPNPGVTLTGLGFSDTLPAGLVLTEIPSNDCGGLLTAPGGAGSLSLSGGVIGPGETCAVAVTVLATGTGPLTDSTTPITSSEGGTGNAASFAINVVGAPRLTVTSPVAGRVYTFEQKVRANFSCAEDPNGPGLISCGGTVPSGSDIDTEEAGAHSFLAWASSSDQGLTWDEVFYTVAPDNHVVLVPPRVHRDGSIDFIVWVPGPGRIHVTETISRGKVVFGRGQAAPKHDGNLHLTIRPTPRGRLAMQRQDNLRVVGAVAYTPKGGTRRVMRFTFTA